MRFGLLDLFFASVCLIIGWGVGSFLSSEFPGAFGPVAEPLAGLCLYLAFIYPFYRGLKLFPMILPRCPVCGQSQHGYHIHGGRWPRIRFQCPSCNGEFVVWHNGLPGKEETWVMPVLTLKWPYAFGVYKRATKPEARVEPNAGSPYTPQA